MICNSTPIILLAKINNLALLKKVFRAITITEDVKDEVLREDKPGYLIIKNAIEEGWLKIRSPKDNQNLQLDKGENSVINLARELKDELIIDDALAITAARELGVKTIRTTTVIFTAVNKKIINKEEGIKLINKLIESGYYINNEYYSKILTKLKS